MHTNQPITVFLFAHQDDEVAFFELISRSLIKGNRVACVYLTNGAWNGVTPRKRNQESLFVLRQLGVSENDIFFLGDRTGIASGQLPLHLVGAEVELSLLLNSLGDISELFTFAWEGGHEDHDAAAWLAARCAKRLNIVDQSFCIPFYRSSLHAFPPFTVFQPLAVNGHVSSLNIRFMQRIRYIGLCLRYRSQWMVMVSLAPFLLFQIFLRGRQYFQPLKVDRFDQQPHAGIVLYESRGRYSFTQMMSAIDAAESTLTYLKSK